MSDQLTTEQPVEFFVRTDPDPNPDVAFRTACNSAAISRYANRPCSRRISDSFETQAGMRWVVREFAIGSLRRRLNLRRQRMIQLPKMGSAPRDHLRSSKSLSRMTGNCSGSLLYLASISSRKASNFGRGRGSRIISFHRASPSSSGSSLGSEPARRARSSAGNLRIASSISATVVMVELIQYVASGDNLKEGRFSKRPRRLKNRRSLIGPNTPC